jgi:6-phosphogluconolactonase
MLGSNYKKMKINNFENINILESTLVKKISLCVSDAIKKYGDARILLSGGSTPRNLYSLLSKENVDWRKVKIGLVDERFVDQTSVFSNESHIKKNLIKNCAKTAILSSMICCIDNESLNLEMVSNSYSCFLERTDFTLLGMGNDGHTASIFPNDKESDELMNSINIGVYSTKAPIYPYNRITCSKAFIAKSNSIVLFFTGEHKFNVLKNSSNTNVPISYFVKNVHEMEIYYTQ